MKKIIILAVGLFSISSLFAQKSTNKNETGFVTCEEFHITKPLREIFANSNVDMDEIYDRDKESEDRDRNIPQKFLKSVEKDGPAYGNDPSTIQTRMGTASSGRAPLHSWAGQAPGGSYPLDPTGAAGKNHFVQMVNATPFKIWSRTGTALLTGTLGSLWSPATTNDGDPIALYDKAADRWFLAQFEVSTRKIFVAISTSADPTGSWYTYTFTAPSTFPDYLKFAVWQDGYYMTCNQSTLRVYALERTRMLAGNASARFVYTTFNPPHTGFVVPLAGDTGDGTLAPAGTPCPIFSYSDNAWGGSAVDGINIFKATVNWVPTTPTLAVASAGVVPTASFDASYNSAWNDISQPGTTSMLDGIGGTLMFRAQYKIWSTYNSVVLCWAVKISATQRSIKWCELRQNQSTGAWSLYQEGIYAPDTDNRWMGSIAMDNNGGIALCYLKSNATSTYPGLYYAGRKPCDPLGTLPIAETTVMAGSGSQTVTNRDGDYSQTWLDPDGYTFWHTGMYLGSGGAQKTQVYSFVLPTCTSANPPAANFVSDVTSICAGQTVHFTDISTNAPSAWAWSFVGPTTLTDTAQDPIVTFATAGTYTVTLTATNAYGSNASTTPSNTIVVNPIPATPTITWVGGSLHSSAATTYKWYKNNVAINGATGQNYTPTLNGTYTVIVTINGCTSSASAPFVVTNAGIAEYTEDSSFRIFPNPSDGLFSVSFHANTKQTYKLRLENTLGQLIYEKVYTDVMGDFEQAIDISNYGKGAYMFILTDEKNQTTKKVMVY
ncbi:MAG: T9SS type A sorting domain-containing protein [Bacteroidota bacterium]